MRLSLHCKSASSMAHRLATQTRRELLLHTEDEVWEQSQTDEEMRRLQL
jgi:hypothetical protein